MSRSRMAPPPATPNAVSSLAPPEDSVHYAAPVAFGCSPDEAMAAVLEAAGRLPRARIREQEDTYLRLVVTSRLWRFKDDVEVQVDPGAGLIHYRSASRVGTSDLGVNRRRMEGVARDIRAALPG